MKVSPKMQLSYILNFDQREEFRSAFRQCAHCGTLETPVWFVSSYSINASRRKGPLGSASRTFFDH